MSPRVHRSWSPTRRTTMPVDSTLRTAEAMASAKLGASRSKPAIDRLGPYSNDASSQPASKSASSSSPVGSRSRTSVKWCIGSLPPSASNLGPPLLQLAAVDLERLSAPLPGARADRPQRIGQGPTALQPNPASGPDRGCGNRPRRHNLVNTTAWRPENVRGLVVTDVAAAHKSHRGSRLVMIGQDVTGSALVDAQQPHGSRHR